MICAATDCDRDAIAKGWCAKHYQRVARFGSPDVVATRLPPGLPLAERMERLSDRTGGADACWTWLGTIEKNSPYGRIWVNGRNVFAHRAAWELANNATVPPGKQVLHSCDNPPCVNPAHLRVGTHQQNMDDKVARGRIAQGAGHGRAKLTPSDVEAIRSLRPTMTCAALAERFGVSRNQVSRVARGKSWATTTKEPPCPPSSSPAGPAPPESRSA